MTEIACAVPSQPQLDEVLEIRDVYGRVVHLGMNPDEPEYFTAVRDTEKFSQRVPTVLLELAVKGSMEGTHELLRKQQVKTSPLPAGDGEVWSIELVDPLCVAQPLQDGAIAAIGGDHNGLRLGRTTVGIPRWKLGAPEW